MTGPVIVDASIATAWITKEEISRQARAPLTSGASLIAPDLLMAEVGNVLWKAARRGELTRELSHPVHDCFYIALAQREGGEVATADARLARLCEAKAIAVRLIPPSPPQPSSSA